VQCNIEVQEAIMARQKSTKPVAAKAAAPKAKTPKAMAQDAVMPAVTEAVVADVSTMTPAETVNSNEGTKTMTDTVKNFAATVSEKASAALKGVQAKAQDAFAKTGEVSKDVLAFHKSNAEAIVESAKVAAGGLQTAAQDGAALTRKNWDASVAHVKALTAVTSPAEFLKLQGEFARHQFDGAVAELTKASEFAVKLTGEVVSPLQNRYAVVAEDVKARLAA
jgi:phasin family protein